MVLELVDPLKASICTRRRGEMKLKLALVGPAPLKPMLLVLNAPYGPERYQRLVPQSTIPLGYCPFRARFGLDRSSNVSVCPPVPPTVGTAVGGAVAPGG